MNIIRIVAVCREGGKSLSEHRIIAVCGIDESDTTAPGEWMGYAKSGSIIYPFVFSPETSELKYGHDENYTERTNFGKQKIVVGNYFTVLSPAGDPEEWESTYEILSVHKY